MAIAAGIAAASTMRHGIAAHTSSDTKLCRQWVGAAAARRVLQIARNIAANTPTATSEHIPSITSRICTPCSARGSRPGRLLRGARRWSRRRTPDRRSGSQPPAGSRPAAPRRALGNKERGGRGPPRKASRRCGKWGETALAFTHMLSRRRGAEPGDSERTSSVRPDTHKATGQN
jgi:hypothetical protein